MRRLFRVHVGGNLPPRGGLRTKARHGGKGRPFVEGRNEPEIHRRTGEWVERVMVIDHDNDRYVERVTSRATGQIIHEVDEPLSQHRGHGNARRPNTQPHQ